MTLNAIRIARPVTDLSLSCRMYCTGLGLEQIAQFADHDGFSGVMVGRRDLGWHLEFTLCHHHPVKPSPGEKDLLVLYYPEAAEWREQCAKMLTAGFVPVSAFNPYWNVNGKTFVDGDGYRVVLQNRSWP
ncbi:VOC family protein [Klebsiella michiganensis]|uniref:VOC family protein n=1 Tax=Klebsiella michiganensis TaxID=1134687 RepID=UPI001B81C168|nr:VOC family protein [Klebsiella michiganensis]MBR7529986.1 VOC family protein [Klebsiella michiganensis]MBR7569227.1 VOC family protein [Klebsiella michiganensis]